MKTQKEQLEEATQQLSEANTQLSDAKAKLTTEVDAHSATKSRLAAVEKERDEAKEKLSAEASAHAETKTKLQSAERERDDLKATDKSAGAKAAELLAAHGIAPSAKDAPGNLDTTAGDPVALWEQYAAAEPTKQASMREQYGAKLDAAAEAYDRAKAGQ